MHGKTGQTLALSPHGDKRVALKPREIIAVDGLFHDCDPQKINLYLQCHDHGIKFICL